MKNNLSNTAQPLQSSAPTLAEDLATLVALVDWNGLRPLEAGFLSGFLPALATRLRTNNDPEPENIAIPQVTLLGGRFVGRSTVLNFLAGEALAETGIWMRQGRLPLAVRIGCQEDDSSAPISDPRYEHQSRWTVAHQSPMDCRAVVWDASDATTHGALGAGIKQLGLLLGTSSVVVLVVSVENYADADVHRLLEWCVSSDCLPVLVLNKTRPETVCFVADDLKKVLGNRISWASLPVVNIPEADPVNLASGFAGQGPLGGVRQTLALEVASAVERFRNRSKQQRELAIANVVSRFLKEQLPWATPIEDFNAVLKASVDRGKLEAEASLIDGARARLSAAGFSLAGKNLLESLELSGYGRVWSLLFRLAGWPLRQWLVGSGGSIPLEEVESVLARALGTWKARVQLEIVPLRNDLLLQHAKIRKAAWRNSESKQLSDGIQAKAAEIDAILVKEANLRAVDLLNERPGLHGFIRSLIATAQGACLLAAVWYGSGGLLSLVYLAVFAGLADLVLVLAVRVPLFLIERSSQLRWLEQMRLEIINPFAIELMLDMKVALGPINDAFEAWTRARRSINNHGLSGDGRP